MPETKKKILEPENRRKKTDFVGHDYIDEYDTQRALAGVDICAKKSSKPLKTKHNLGYKEVILNKKQRNLPEDTQPEEKSDDEELSEEHQKEHVQSDGKALPCITLGK